MCVLLPPIQIGCSPCPTAQLPCSPCPTTTSHPAGARASDKGFTPSAALVKAVLLGGAASITGFEADTGLPVDPTPSFRQGFGRVFLGELEWLGSGWHARCMHRWCEQAQRRPGRQGHSAGVPTSKRSARRQDTHRLPEQHLIFSTLDIYLRRQLGVPGQHAWKPPAVSGGPHAHQAGWVLLGWVALLHQLPARRASGPVPAAGRLGSGGVLPNWPFLPPHGLLQMRATSTACAPTAAPSL